MRLGGGLRLSSDQRSPGRFWWWDGGQRSVGELGVDMHLARRSSSLGLGTLLRLELKLDKNVEDDIVVFYHLTLGLTITLDAELLEGLETFTYIGASESLFKAPDVVVLLAVVDVKLGFM